MLLLGEVGGAPSGSAAFLHASLPAPTTQCCRPVPGLRLEPPVGVCCTPRASGCWWMRSCRAQRVPGLAPASRGQSAVGTGAVLAPAPSTAQSGRGQQAGAGKSLRFIKRHFESYKRGLPTQPSAGAGPGRTSRGRGQGEPATPKASLRTNQPPPQEKTAPGTTERSCQRANCSGEGLRRPPRAPVLLGALSRWGRPGVTQQELATLRQQEQSGEQGGPSLVTKCLTPAWLRGSSTGGTPSGVQGSVGIVPARGVAPEQPELHDAGEDARHVGDLWSTRGRAALPSSWCCCCPPPRHQPRVAGGDLLALSHLIN